MILTKTELVSVLKQYIDSEKALVFATPDAIAEQILLAEAKAQQKQNDITDRIMWGTD